jgi:hypothetical protein
MKVFLNNVGIIKETEKAVLICVVQGGFSGTKWVPKSQIKLSKVSKTHNFYYTYHNMKFVGGRLSDGTARKNFYDKKANAEVSAWFYKKNLQNAIGR